MNDHVAEVAPTVHGIDAPDPVHEMPDIEQLLCDSAHQERWDRARGPTGRPSAAVHGAEVAFDHEGNHPGVSPRGVALTSGPVRRLKRSDRMPNAVRSGDPAVAAHNTEQLGGGRLVLADHLSGPEMHAYAHPPLRQAIIRPVPLPPVPITTDRLVLRPWVDGDVAALAAAIGTSLEHLRPWMPWIAHEPLTMAGRRELIAGFRASWERDEELVVGVLLGDQIVGGAGLHRRGGPTSLDIGYWIHKDHCRQGYATETAGALSDAALAMPDIDHVRILHDVANTASSGVPARLGFTKIGEQEAPIAAPNETGMQSVWERRE